MDTATYHERLRAELEGAREEREADETYWTNLATSQDTEEAEHSGYLNGFEDGLALALELHARK